MPGLLTDEALAGHRETATVSSPNRKRRCREIGLGSVFSAIDVPVPRSTDTKARDQMF